MPIRPTVLSGVGMQKHLLHAQGIGNQAGVLPPGTAKAAECVLGNVIPPLDGDFFDRVRHLFHRNGQEARRYLLRRSLVARFPMNLLRQFRKFLTHNPSIQGLIPIGTKHIGKKLRLQLAHHHIAVRYRQRSPIAVAGRTGIGPRRLWPHPIAGTVEADDRAAPRCYGVGMDQSLVPVAATPATSVFKGALVLPPGSGTTSVEVPPISKPNEPGHNPPISLGLHGPGPHHPAGPERMLSFALKQGRIVQAAVGLHEHEAGRGVVGWWRWVGVRVFGSPLPLLLSRSLALFLPSSSPANPNPHNRLKNR